MNERPIWFAGALLLATLPAAAQDGSTTSSSAQVTAASPASASKTVWTNDDMNDLRVHSPSSPAGEADATITTGHQAPAPPHKDAKWYHDQIEKLQKQLPPIEREIADLQAALEGKPTGDTKSSTRPRAVKGGTWQDDLAGLRQKHDDIATRIATLQDQARHAGVPASALP